MINPQWLELPMSRTIFCGPKDVRAIEVRLYTVCLGLFVLIFEVWTDQTDLSVWTLHLILYSLGWVYCNLGITANGLCSSLQVISGYTENVYLLQWKDHSSRPDYHYSDFCCNMPVKFNWGLEKEKNNCHIFFCIARIRHFFFKQVTLMFVFVAPAFSMEQYRDPTLRPFVNICIHPNFDPNIQVHLPRTIKATVMILGMSLHLGMTNQTAVSIFDRSLYFIVRRLYKFMAGTT